MAREKRGERAAPVWRTEEFYRKPNEVPSMEIALTLLAFSPPAAALIFKFVPRRGGDFVSAREFDAFCADVRGELRSIRSGLEMLQIMIRSK